jgi:hypothetical protein
LSKHESEKTLLKTKKRATHFPQRKYAIKVGPIHYRGRLGYRENVTNSLQAEA